MAVHRRKYIVASVCGFCRGVKRAVALFDEACGKGSVYVLHELVHNKSVSNSMISRGAVFVDKCDEIPDGATVLIGAHGVSDAVETSLRRRCTVIDATCPRVKALQSAAAGVSPVQELVMLCKPHHPEATGVMGCAVTPYVYPVSSVADIEKLPELHAPFLLAQTTMSGKLVSEVESCLKKRYPALVSRCRICDASEKRQKSAAELAGKCDVVFVAGSAHSSNAVELVNIIKSCGVGAYLVDSGEDIRDFMIENAVTAGITAGASTPDELIQDVAATLEKYGFSNGDDADD